MEHLLQDVRYAVRLLAKSPGFVAVATLSLALGIGANSAIFSIMDAVLLRLLPVASPEQLVLVSSTGRRGQRFDFSHQMYKDLQEGNKVLSGLLAHGPVALSMTVDGQTERVLGEIVTGSYFSVLGVKAVLGRTLTTDDDRIPGAHPVAVISHGLWQRRFGLDPAVVGRVINLSGRAFTVVGVVPASFTGTEVGFAPDVRVPMMMQPQLMPGWDALNRRDRSWLQILGRLKPGSALAQSEAAMDTLFQQLQLSEFQSYPPNISERLRRDGFLDRRLKLERGSRGLSRLRNQISRPLFVSMAVVGLVLLIACANVANLLLARALARQKEIALRLAVGASRGRLIRQLLTESVLLSLAGGLAGLLLAFQVGRILLGFLPQGPVPITLNLEPDVRIIGFTFFVSVLAGILFGLAPALLSTRPELTPALKDEVSLFGKGTRQRLTLRRILVVAQVALSIVLLIGAGLFVRTLRNLQELDPGFTRDRILLLSLDPSLNGYGANETRSFYERLLERVQVLPGIRSASLARVNPLTGGGMRRTVSIQGYQPRADEDMNINSNFVGARYFETMGIPLLLGREFTPRDGPGAPRVAIINETMARRFWSNENPIGRRIDEAEVIGVARDGKYRSLREDTRSTVYLSFLQEKRAFEMNLHLRTAGDPKLMIAAVRREVEALDKNLPIFNVKTLAEQLDASLVIERMVSTITSFFGLLALLLAAVGLYGVMAYTVARRTREIGIRMALGAQRPAVLGLVLRETLGLVLAGLAAGLLAAFWAARLISSMLYGIDATDPVTFVSVSLIMTAIALLAGYFPARRATKVDPVIALRYE